MEPGRGWVPERSAPKCESRITARVRCRMFAETRRLKPISGRPCSKTRGFRTSLTRGFGFRPRILLRQFPQVKTAKVIGKLQAQVEVAKSPPHYREGAEPPSNSRNTIRAKLPTYWTTPISSTEPTPFALFLGVICGSLAVVQTLTNRSSLQRAHPSRG